MIPDRDRLPAEASLLSDEEIERIYALPVPDDDTIDRLRRLLVAQHAHKIKTDVTH